MQPVVSIFLAADSVTGRVACLLCVPVDFSFSAKKQRGDPRSDRPDSFRLAGGERSPTACAPLEWRETRAAAACRVAITDACGPNQRTHWLPQWSREQWSASSHSRAPRCRWSTSLLPFAASESVRSARSVVTLSAPHPASPRPVDSSVDHDTQPAPPRPFRRPPGDRQRPARTSTQWAWRLRARRLAASGCADKLTELAQTGGHDQTVTVVHGRSIGGVHSAVVVG
jgi:hypothetical protein